MSQEAQEIMKKLNHIESDLKFIKEHLTDIDLVFTDDDRESIQQAEKEFREGKTKRLA